MAKQYIHNNINSKSTLTVHMQVVQVRRATENSITVNTKRRTTTSQKTIQTQVHNKSNSKTTTTVDTKVVQVRRATENENTRRQCIATQVLHNQARDHNKTGNDANASPQHYQQRIKTDSHHASGTG